MSAGIYNLGRRCTDKEHEELYKLDFHACYFCGKIIQKTTRRNQKEKEK